jgi:release factor glutamine methyltransferase
VTEDENLEFLLQELCKDFGLEAKVLRRMAASVKHLTYEKIFRDGGELAVTFEEKQLILQMVTRYRQREPLSKILNEKSFWKHDFFVNQHVLDPRPETELIIEAVQQRFAPCEQLNFLDLGVGSGCILLSLLGEFPNARGTGLDISPQAIEVAIHNQRRLGSNGARFRLGDWNDFPETTEKFDVIVSNPPYVPTNDLVLLDENVRKYDPVIALDGGPDGLDAFFAIGRLSQKLLTQHGLIFFEVGFGQAEKVANILRKNDYQHINIFKDFSGIDRVLVAARTAQI